MRQFKKVLSAAVALCVVNFTAVADIDPNLPDYERASGVSGNLNSIGSDTLNNLMTLWAEEFNKFYPNVNIQIQGAGSSTAPPALTEGTATLAPMSREMRQSEIEAFENKFGYAPYALPVAIDMVAVFVNKDNPIEGLSLPEVDAIFSATRRGGYPENIDRWGQVGLTGAWDNRDFALYSRNAVSGTYGFFKDMALFGGDYKPSINEQPGSSSVVQGVSESINGIGYSGIGYQTSSVRAIPLAVELGGEYFEPTAENAATGAYPLSRYLFIYINKHPNRPLDPMMREFVKMVYSNVGQGVVYRDGYVPLPASLTNRVLADLGIE
ncbi:MULTISPECIES: PstS family phosphate ABC transporter substrate-binding protein [Gammaproteobacteria]|uniref:PstS family phosphate ABC transporter substrate-binding protein n=1 Tax=Gammaproteobacteria TaxID=1236 RepID=UPI000DD0010A|nr:MULTISPECIES: phosphate ABC transporter substrate-binding protein PstS family protein [Gammaproteobacteria]RTE85539.1 phosphate ABC transporter substrate-binding protein PstS family protein [Aliidiomarina sp. B3213]TCZ89508.1 phosphate ABC transporter substrate-binding protein PstS family protein [Lysobacter sp. N42]